MKITIIKNEYSWHKWFAWFPICIKLTPSNNRLPYNNKWVWLENINRIKFTSIKGTDFYSYR